jgi:hypothetical protein
MPPFSAQWIAFCREAAIAGQSISAGLTALRKANYAATDLYSHSFFSLSVGLERLLKLIYLIDHAIENDGAYPTENNLRNRFGHDIEKLFDYARLFSNRLVNNCKAFDLDHIGLEVDIIKFLSRFSKSTRYYN